MSGSISGGKKAARTNKARYGKDFYATIGGKGGKTITDKPKGFAYNNNGSVYGRLGGQLSHRPRNIDVTEPLKQSEMEQLLRLSGLVIQVMKDKGIIDESREKALVQKAWDLAGNDEWQKMFKTLGHGTGVQMVWIRILNEEYQYYRNEIMNQTISDIEKQNFKDVKNLIKAFELVTGKKVK